MTPAQAADVQLNIVIVILDDVCPHDVFSWAGASDPVYSPNMDRLASEGTVYQRFYTMPNCSSTRASLLTITTPKYHGLTEALMPDDTFEISVGHTSLYREMAARGYYTSHIGKWHTSNDPMDISSRGVDWSSATIGNVDDYRQFEFWTNGYPMESSVAYHSEWCSTMFWHHLGLSDPPMFCVISFQAAHEPFHIPPLGTYKCDISDDKGKWRASVEAIDYYLGEVISKANKLKRPTIFAVFGDNGSPPSVTYAPQGERKGTVGEGGIRNFLVVHGPGILARTVWTPTPVYALSASLAFDGTPLINDLRYRGVALSAKAKPLGGRDSWQRAVLLDDYKLEQRYEDGNLEEKFYLINPESWVNGNPIDPPRCADAMRKLIEDAL